MIFILNENFETRATGWLKENAFPTEIRIISTGIFQVRRSYYRARGFPNTRCKPCFPSLSTMRQQTNTTSYKLNAAIMAYRALCGTKGNP